MQLRRPKIYCQFVKHSTLEPLSGDRINEIRFYRALASFADVYYNDCLIDWESGVIGDPDGLRSPSRNYDLYYVRNNPELFKSLPHPKITMAYPYDSEVFATADALVVTTDSWRNLLFQHATSLSVQNKLAKWYPMKMALPAIILNIQQTIDPMFIEPSMEHLGFDWRVKTTGAQVFGFFGRVTEETVPVELLEGLKLVRDRLSTKTTPLALFAGSIRTPLPSSVVSVGQLPYGKMPSVFAACRATLGQNCADSDFLGSGKILDSMATMTPVVTQRNGVREEQLGSAYGGSYDSKDEAVEILYRLSTDDAFRLDLSNYLAMRREHFLPHRTGERIRASLVEHSLI